MEHSTITDLKIRPLTGANAAQVENVRIQSLSDEEFQLVQDAFYEHTMLVFRNQKLTPDEQLAFTKRWGPVYITPYVEKLANHPEVLPVKNWGKEKTITEAWHSDATFLAEPPGIAILAAQVIPAAGGDTMFSNGYAAYQGLSDRMKQLVENLNCVHIDTVLAKFAGIVDKEIKPSTHPVVRTHPVTKRKCLFVNNLFSSHFEGMTIEESRGLLGYLCEHAHRHEFIYRHMWQPGDLIMWDNRCALHYAVHDYGSAERTLYRTTVAGGKPV
jgi:taurine dioxygenase